MFIDPTTWCNNNNYKEALHVVNTINVINDAAERGIVLINDYNRTLTHSEEQQQQILQVVESHRKKYKKCVKSEFTN